MKLNLRWLYVFIFLFLGAAHKATAQDNGWDRIAVVKFSPSVLFEPRGGYQFGLELPLAANFSLQAEYAHLPYTWQGLDIVFFEPRPGFYASAYKAEARYYFTDRDMYQQHDKKFQGKDIQGFYIAGQAQLKHATSVKSAFIEDSVRVRRTVYYNRQSSVFKANFKLGYQIIFDHGFVLDAYAGLGYRHVNIKNNPPPFNESLAESMFLYIPVNIALGMKIGMAF